MKKKITFKKLTSGLLSALLALLGFTACSSEEDDPLVLMYAPAPTFYGIKGKVVEKDNADNVLSGIQVVAYPILDKDKTELKERADTLFTDSNGRFIYEEFHHPTIRLIFEDINIPEDEISFESFAKDTIDIELDEMTREELYKGITVELRKIQVEQPDNEEKDKEN